MNIVITGASRGIGAELVRSLATDEGHTIIGIARSRDNLVALRQECHAKRCPSNFYGIVVDFGVSMDFENLISQINTLVPHIDILVNNAGQMVNKPLDKLAESDFDQVFSVNVKVPFLLIRALLPFMKPGSHIVNISSMGGVQGSEKYKGLSLYSASKGALAVLTECLAVELADRQIYINCLAPGAVQTEMLAEAFPGYKAPVTASAMGEYIAQFALTAHKVMNGKIIPLAFSNP
jgi:NAD(P)-dependent dehydrogenase (short-subunit alcohol dehydrogenase family)